LPEYAALDLETTGLDPARDRVIEIGAVAFTPEGVTSRLEQLVDPGRSVPEPVLRLTGIRPEELRGAADAGLALRALNEFLKGRQPVGHGARLDVDFLAAAGLWDHEQEILDTLDVARILLPAAASHSLPLLATELGFSQPRPHRALDDADATRQLLLRLREEAVALDPKSRPARLTLARLLVGQNEDGTGAVAPLLEAQDMDAAVLALESAAVLGTKPAAEERVFEMRTYIASPGKTAALHSRFRDHTFKLFEKHGMTNIGYWQPAFGDKAENTLVYILAYPSKEARDASWKAFQADEDWKKVKAESEKDGVPLAAKVTSVFMKGTDYSTIK